VGLPPTPPPPPPPTPTPTPTPTPPPTPTLDGERRRPKGSSRGSKGLGSGCKGVGSGCLARCPPARVATSTHMWVAASATYGLQPPPRMVAASSVHELAGGWTSSGSSLASRSRRPGPASTSRRCGALVSIARVSIATVSMVTVRIATVRRHRSRAAAVRAALTYGCSLRHQRLQPLRHTAVAGAGTARRARTRWTACAW
jgi:hypothetical protein